MDLDDDIDTEDIWQRNQIAIQGEVVDPALQVWVSYDCWEPDTSAAPDAG
jgi:hypothetical protein